MKSKATVSNRMLAILLRREAENAEGVMGKALRRAAHSALLWPQEASAALDSGRPLTDLHSVGPRLSKLIASWLRAPPRPAPLKPEEEEFLTLAEARQVLAKHPAWKKRLHGDLQMHTTWSDGSGSIEEMARAATERGYRYIGITDHTKGLTIAGGNQ